MSEQTTQPCRIALYPEQYLTVTIGGMDESGNVVFDLIASFPETDNDNKVGTITVAVHSSFSEHDLMGKIKRAAGQLREGLVDSLDFIIETSAED